MARFRFPSITHDHDLCPGEKEACTIEPEPEDPIEWIEAEISLPVHSAYAKPGPVRFDAWQKYPIRLALKSKHLKRLNIRSSVQVGKSFVAEMIMTFLMRWRSSKLMLCYSIQPIVRRVIKERLLPLIRANPVLRRLTTGIADDMSMEYITLKNGTLRLAYAESENTIASFSVPYIIASEVAKYHNPSADIPQLLNGRTTWYHKTGEYLEVFESSPKWDDDYFGKECKKSQVQLYPFVKLSCGHWAHLEDRIIQVAEDEHGSPIKNPDALLSSTRNAWLKCPVCSQRTFEDQHYAILQTVVWARAREEIVNDSQPDYSNYKSVTINANKLLNEGYTFVQCMADFFYADSQVDGGLALRTYNNETMGREIKRADSVKQRTEMDDLEPQKLRYDIYSPEPVYPEEIKFALVGMDTQDKSFYEVVRGFTGKNADTYLMSAEEISYDYFTETKEDIRLRVFDATFGKEFVRADGYRIPVLAGMVDHGGHRAELVNYITAKIPRLYKYKGSSRSEIAVLEKKDSGIYHGNTRQLSQIVHQLLTECNFYLPWDVSDEYWYQLKQEYFKNRMTNKGPTVDFYQGERNHFRSAENYCQAAAYLMGAYKPEDGRWLMVLDRVLAERNTPIKEKKQNINPFENLFNGPSSPNWW